jgi:hypothetical protein
MTGSVGFKNIAGKFCTTDKPCGPGCVWNGANDVCITGLPVGGTPTAQNVEDGGSCSGG